MIVAAKYYFNDKPGKYIDTRYGDLLSEVFSAISQVDAEIHKTKEGREKTNTGKLLYSPRLLNAAYKEVLNSFSWYPHKFKCEYSAELYTDEYLTKYGNYIPKFKQATREIDFVKEKLGIEVQFGKYAFMAYDILGKMAILNEMDVIDAGIEIVPVRRLTQTMSTGVSYFEQIVCDLQNRGASNLDIPVLIIGVDS